MSDTCDWHAMHVFFGIIETALKRQQAQKSEPQRRLCSSRVTQPYSPVNVQYDMPLPKCGRLFCLLNLAGNRPTGQALPCSILLCSAECGIMLLCLCHIAGVRTWARLMQGSKWCFGGNAWIFSPAYALEWGAKYGPAMRSQSYR